VRGNPQALFGKRPTEKDPAKGTSPAVDFTREGGCAEKAQVQDSRTRDLAAQPTLLNRPVTGLTSQFTGKVSSTRG
jgi:hypothetical protein